MSSIAYLTSSTAQLAYHRLAGASPGIIFCAGFLSTMQSSKAAFLEQLCREQGRAFVRFDYRGHGESPGDLTQLNIGSWLADTLEVLTELTTGPQIIVGSSMGAWIAALAVVARPARFKKFIGIAAAPDFTENLIWQRLSAELRTQLLNMETLYFPTEYPDKSYVVTHQLIEAGRQHLVLAQPLAIHCPVQLIHGMQDAAVPWQTSLQLAEQIQSNDVKLTLIKDGDHRLARDQDLALLAQIIVAS